MYKKYHNMLQVVLAVSPSSGGLNKTTGDLKEEIKNFYINDELFIGDKMVSKNLLRQFTSTCKRKSKKASTVVNKCDSSNIV